MESYKSYNTWSSMADLFHLTFFFFFFFSFLATLRRMDFLGQGSNLSFSFEAAATQDPLTHCAGLGMEPASWCCRDTADPIGLLN